MKQIKRLFFVSIAVSASALLIGYRMGQQDARSELRHEYPYLQNLQRGDIDPKPGDIWLTHNPTKDTFAVNVYRDGWKRVYVYP